MTPSQAVLSYNHKECKLDYYNTTSTCSNSALEPETCGDMWNISLKSLEREKQRQMLKVKMKCGEFSLLWLFCYGRHHLPSLGINLSFYTTEIATQ